MVDIECQPIVIDYLHAGEPRRTTPDFRITLVGGTQILIEVKHSNQLRDPELRALLKSRQKGCAEQRLRYEVVTDRWIRFQPVLENLRLLSRWRGSYRLVENDPVLDRTGALLPLPLTVVAYRLGSRAAAAAAVLGGRFHMNLCESISLHSTITSNPHRQADIALSLPWETKQGLSLWWESL